MGTAPGTLRGTVSLRDGRRLAFQAAGPEDGRPVLYLHGAIGSPLALTPELQAAIDELRLRYLMVCRPGFGQSDPLPGRRIVDFARDVEDLADALGFERFGVVGVSAGGPYALACAHALPERLTAAALVSSLAPIGPPHACGAMPKRLRLPLRLLAATPGTAARLGDGALGVLARHPWILWRVMCLGAPSADRRLLADSEARRAAARSFLAAAGGGVSGMVEDYLACCAPWGFEPARTTGEVHLWHGMKDRFVPVEHALRLSVTLPRCQAAFDPDEGHFFFKRRLREILRGLVPDAAPSRGCTSAGASAAAGAAL